MTATEAGALDAVVASGTWPPDAETAFRALSSRDSRFDGRLWFGVTSTGVYCRPVCPAQTPKPENVRLFASTAAAVASGYRACRRCRPDSAPGSRHWDHRGDLAARAVRLIASGAADDGGVVGLAQRLGVSERQLHRTLVAEVGATPSALAGSRRAQTARLLLDQTDLPVTEVAFAAGFASLRAFNDSMLREFGAAPTRLRAQRRSAVRPPAAPGGLTLRLRVRPPYDSAQVAGYLRTHAVPGVELVFEARVTRALMLPHGTARVDVTLPGREPVVVLSATGVDLRDVTALVPQVRRWLDLDADPGVLAATLGGDPVLAPLLAARPGVRVVTAPDPWEALVRAVVGQQVTLAAARTLLGRLAESAGESFDDGLRAFPTPDAVAGLGVDGVAGVGLPRSRAAALVELAERVADGRLSLGADPIEVRRGLLEVRGVGEWTAQVFALRGSGDPDAFPPADLVLRRSYARLGGDPLRLAEAAAAWRPWRAYAAAHLWLAAVDPTHAGFMQEGERDE